MSDLPVSQFDNVIPLWYNYINNNEKGKIMKFSVFYGCDPGMIVKARDKWDAIQKAIVILEKKYPNRRIREWDLAVNI